MHILKTKLQLLKKIDIECYDFFLKKSMLRKYTISGTEYTYVYAFSVCLMCVEQLFITKESRSSLFSTWPIEGITLPPK